MAVSTYSITWYDPDAVAPFIGGYPNPPGVASAGTLSALATDVYLGQNVVKATCAAPHGLEVGRLYKVTLAGTGTTADGLQKVVVKSATELWVLLPTLTGAFVPGSAWTLYQYAGVGTGWPELREVALSTPIVQTVQIAVKSPYTFTLLPSRTNNDPEAYDPANNVLLDDIVVWGLGTAVPIIPEAYHECLAQYAILTLKSSLNESDSEVAALLKEMFTSMKGDTSGRRLGCRMERTFSLRSNYLTQSRRMGRR
jgi:hypothetical protein